MDADELDFEEGELVSDDNDDDDDDSDDKYTPLERPANYSAAVQPNQRYPSGVIMQPESDSEIEFERSSSESTEDSDDVGRRHNNSKKSKRKKVTLKRPPLPAATTTTSSIGAATKSSTTRKRYDIWSTRVQEDVLAETLNCCDVTKKDRSRDVESYDYNISVRNRLNNKRTRDDRGNSNLRLVGGGRQQQQQVTNGKDDDDDNVAAPRFLLDLGIDDLENSSPDEIARDMANKLYEEKEDLILQVINVMGKDKSIALYKETKRIEEKGGMLIMNQTRRRTPGGVFLFLLRHDDALTVQQKKQIFGDEKELNKIRARERQKKRVKKMKEQIAASKPKFLPDLLTRAELLAKDQNRTRKQTNNDSNDVVVINPPPTPETDGGHENSGDGMDGVGGGIDTGGGDDLLLLNKNDTLLSSTADDRRKLMSYGGGGDDDDFLDIGCSNNDNMDLF